MAWPFVKSTLAPFRAPLDGSGSPTRTNAGVGICEPVSPPPGGPGQNSNPFPGAPVKIDNAGRPAPVLTTWFDDNGTAQACFPGNLTALGVGAPGQVGPPGPPGPQGNQGNPGQAATIMVGNVSSTAPGGNPSITNSGSGTNAVLNFVLPQGDVGPAGATGNNGNSIQVRGSVPTASALPTSGMVIGDIWIAQDSGNGFQWNGATWVNVGQMRGVPGPAGPVGPAGPSINLKGSVATEADLPTTGNSPNDGWITTDTGDLWIWNGSAWENVGKITGPQGPQGATGAPGPAGANGAAATIAVGTVTTLPAGSPATVVNAGTSGAALFNFGIPQGQVGPQGNPGATGATGPQGPAFTPATTGTGSTFVLQTGASIANATLQSPAITSGATVAGNVTQTGDLILTGRAWIAPATAAALPAAALAGTVFAALPIAPFYSLNNYFDGTNNRQYPGSGAGGSGNGSGSLSANANGLLLQFAPPVADNAITVPVPVATLTPTNATFPGNVNTATNTGQFLNGAGQNIVSARAASGPGTQFYTTTSQTAVMTGINANITPRLTGRLLMIACGMAATNATSGTPYLTIVCNYGTGTPPVAGAAATGNQASATIYPTQTLNSTTTPWTVLGLTVGAAIGTQYWFQLAAGANGAYNAQLNQVQIVVIEI